MNRNLYALFEARFPAQPSTISLKLSTGEEVTYGELAEQAARYAHALRNAGAQPGDRVAVQVDKSPEAVFLYLGCLRAGCVFLPMNPAYQRGEITHLLSDAEPAIFVVRPEGEGVALSVAAEVGVPAVMTLAEGAVGSLPELAARQPTDFATHCTVDDDLAAILYTSGTTGRPKGAMLTHGNLYAGVSVLHKYWAFQPGDVLLHVLPIFHIHGLFVALHCALWNGSTILFESRFEPQRVLRLLEEATVCMGVPTHYVRLLAQPELDEKVCGNMRLFISGSAPLLPDTFNRFRVRTGHTILERYGMTEGGMFVSNPYAGERRCGTVGCALPGVSLRVVDEHDVPVAPGEIGHIQVKGANVFKGYWRLPEKTAEEHTPDGYFKTGDLGSASADGYLSVVGRNKDLIISGGLNVYPKEVEIVIDTIPGVAESAIIGVPHLDLGEAVTAVVVRSPGDTSATAAGIIASVKAKLAGYKVPRFVYFVDELPRNTMGKVQKNVLREQFQNHGVRVAV